ncbi:MAG TPA: DsbA family protein, partial [Anaeromyxobacteraceae bacterium]|nr:DsbA family protein [Anaeromyxobacteraceae bacterium]
IAPWTPFHPEAMFSVDEEFDMKAVDLEITSSDFICPWCYIVEERLRQITGVLGGTVDVHVRAGSMPPTVLSADFLIPRTSMRCPANPSPVVKECAGAGRACAKDPLCHVRPPRYNVRRGTGEGAEREVVVDAAVSGRQDATPEFTAPTPSTDRSSGSRGGHHQ